MGHNHEQHLERVLHQILTELRHIRRHLIGEPVARGRLRVGTPVARFTPVPIPPGGHSMTQIPADMAVPLSLDPNGWKDAAGKSTKVPDPAAIGYVAPSGCDIQVAADAQSVLIQGTDPGSGVVLGPAGDLQVTVNGTVVIDEPIEITPGKAAPAVSDTFTVGAPVPRFTPVAPPVPPAPEGKKSGRFR